MAGLLAALAEFARVIVRERAKAGIARARTEGKPHGCPRTATLHAKPVRQLRSPQLSQSEVARRSPIGRTPVRRILAAQG
jgi:putative DNA-invertase from lambdoid prophage Rac